MTDKQLTETIRVVPDFPVKGIQFFDVTTLFKNPESFNEVLDRIAAIYKDKGITKVAGIESRGFIAGAGSERDSYPFASRANFLLKPYPNHTPKNMARTPSKSMQMPSARKTWC